VAERADDDDDTMGVSEARGTGAVKAEAPPAAARRAAAGAANLMATGYGDKIWAGGGMAYSTINIRGDGGKQQAAREEADSIVVVLVRWCHRGTEGSGTGDVFSEFAKGESEKMMLLKGQRQF